ncbi:peptidylprolyl isomerase [Thalassolituus sp. LLYu03]|uniref:peptidylprolyl isomerase n=1 Tax=Thalassolituus sp. LLYu03 TaxID=3421656 RepID=UPI003D290875
MSTIALHHILLKSPLLAADILQELSLGADFGELAAEYSACPSASQQGFAGYHDTDALPTSIVKALFEYEGNDPYLGPVTSPLGFHIFKTIARPERKLLMEESGE